MEYPEPKHFNYQIVVDSKIYVKKHKYELRKILIQYNRMATYTKNQRCDIYIDKEKNYQYVKKKYCTTCVIKKEKYTNCKILSPKYTTNGYFFLNYKFLFAN